MATDARRGHEEDYEADREAEAPQERGSRSVVREFFDENVWWLGILIPFVAITVILDPHSVGAWFHQFYMGLTGH